ncbi:MAG: hypothetical protein ABW000_05790 [Actinoplanes sp.]
MGLHDAIYRAQESTPHLADSEQRIIDELAERDQEKAEPAAVETDR